MLQTQTRTHKPGGCPLTIEAEAEPTPAMAEKEEKKPQKPDEDPVGKVYDSRLIQRLGHYLRPYSNT